MIIQVSRNAPLALQAGAALILTLHIGGGFTGMASGWTAMLAAKGRRLHRRAGRVFFAAMLVMSGIGAAVAPFLPTGKWTNTTAGAPTFYLVATAWVTVRRPAGEIGRFERGVVAVPLALTVVGLALAWVGVSTGTATDYAALYVFDSVAVLAAAADLGMIRRGGLGGVDRIARHLWRMSLALLIATSSFFEGQQKFLPPAVRDTLIPSIPVVAAFGLMLFWIIRVRIARPDRVSAAQ